MTGESAVITRRGRRRFRSVPVSYTHLDVYKRQAYTTVTDDEIPIQVNIDLVNYRLERYLNDEHLETRQYGSRCV